MRSFLQLGVGPQCGLARASTSGHGCWGAGQCGALALSQAAGAVAPAAPEGRVALLFNHAGVLASDILAKFLDDQGLQVAQESSDELGCSLAGFVTQSARWVASAAQRSVKPAAPRS